MGVHALGREHLPAWSLVSPIAGWLLLAASAKFAHPLFLVLLGAVLVACILAAVHHSEVVAHRVGEPFGTLVLALAVTVIEVGLIVSLMMVESEDTATLARDTIFAVIMINLNGMVGLSLLLGSSKHGEQAFGLYGVNAALATLAAMATITLVLPNTTSNAAGPIYLPSQLGMVAVVTFVLYAAFVLIQTVSHRDYFLPETDDSEAHAEPPTTRVTLLCGAILVVSLGAVVLLAKVLAPSIEVVVDNAGAPRAVVGIIIAAVVLLPECFAALKAARRNRLQTSMNLALGSTLASIGLTIPAVALVVISTGWTLVLGLDSKSVVLLALTLLVATLSLGTGRTTILQGVVHLVIFAVYLFLSVVP
ncbi:MAG TPA: ionic transporter y4hA [Lysobacter sp.]